VRTSNGQGRPDERDDHTLGENLAAKAANRCAERCSNRELLSPPVHAHEKQIAHVGACHQQ
jgi:hypothetical protein